MRNLRVFKLGESGMNSINDQKEALQDVSMI